MLKKLDRQAGARFLLTAASLVVVIAGVRAAAPILLPFLLALFLAILNLPLLGWLRGKRLPSPLAVLLTVAVNGTALLVLGLFVSRSIEAFIIAMPRYAARFEMMYEAAATTLEHRGIPVAEWVSLDMVNPGALFDFLSSTVRGIAAVLTNVFLVLLILVFVLSEAAAFPAKVRAALGNADADLSRLSTMTREVQRFLYIKTLISLATGLLIGTSVWLLGLDFALLLGILAFLLNYVPNIGSILAAVPGIMLALIQYGFSRAIAVGLAYLAVNVLLGNILEPNLMGRKFGLSTLVVVLSLIFWGWVLGPVGMLLSVPLTMVLKIMLEHTEDFRWLAILLGGPEDATAPRTAVIEPAPQPQVVVDVAKS